MITKSSLKKQLEKFPESFSIEELMERMIVIDKIETGNKQSENGQIITDAELTLELEKWFG